jgi:TP901 family phage tail tape measure protein
MPISAQGLGYFFSTTDRASPGIKSLNKNVKELGDASVAAQQKYDRSMKLIRQGTKEMLIGGLGIATINSLTDTYGKFEIKLASAGAVMNATALQMKQLEKAAINAGIATQFDPREAAEGLENLGAAGMSAEQAMATLNPVLDLAAASLGQLGVGEAAANVVGVLNAFGDSADNAQKRVDQLVKITQMSNFQARDFSVAISQAAAQASAADQSFESMTATLGLLRNTNLDASSAATAYREAVRRVSGEELAIKKLRKLGISTMDKQTGKIKDLGRIMAEVIPKVQSLSSQQKNLTLKTVFGVRGMKTFNAFLASYNKLVKEGKIETGDFAGAHTLLVQGLNNAGGAAAKTRDKLLATAEGQRILLKGSIETFKVVAGKALVPVILPAIKAITTALNVLIKIFSAIGPEVRAFASHFIGVGAAMLAVSGAIKILLGVRGLIGLSKAAAAATAANTALAASETAVAGATKAANAEQAKRVSGLQRMRAGIGNMVSRVAGFLPVIGIVGSAMSALFASRRAAEKKEVDRQKKIRAEQVATRQAYINTITVVEQLGKVAEKAGDKLVKSAQKNRKAAEQSLGTVRDTIVKNLTTAQKKERELIEIGRKLRTFGFTEAEKKRLQQRQLQLKQDVLVAEKRAEKFALAELKIRAEQAKRIPAFKRTEEQNRDIVAANTFKITKMRQNEATLQKKITETRSVFQTKGIIKRRKQLEKELSKMRKAREKFTLRTAKLTGFAGRGVGAAGRAIKGFAAPRLAEAGQFGGIEARTGLGRGSLFQIMRGTARPELLQSRSPEQRAAIEEWIRSVADPSGRFAKTRAAGPAPAAVKTAGRGAEDIATQLDIVSAAGSRSLALVIANAVKTGIEESKLNVTIDGQDVPTENKKRSERTAKGKPTKPAK